MSGKPSLRYRRIGMALRDLRDAKGLTVAAAARCYGRSQGWLSTIENGLTAIRSDELRDLLDYYDCEDAQLREALIYLADRGRQRGWWRTFDQKLPVSAVDYASLEADANGISTHQMNLVPGLLQSEDYARALIEASIAARVSGLVDALVAFRMNRQQVLERAAPPRLEAVVGEAALRQEIGGKTVMRSQITKLIEQAGREHISLRVLPYRAGAHAGLDGPFTILDVGQPVLLSVVLIDSLARSWYLEEDADLDLYREAFRSVSDAALTRSESLTFMQEIASHL